MKVCVFCGSRAGNSDGFVQAAQMVGKTFAENGIDLVYGGGHVGMMGAVADAVMENGGRVYGVIPEQLQQKELAHHGLTELFVVKDMHERKMKMAEWADAFIALPGGVGTLEEIFEQWTWLQLSIHDKPSAFLNVESYYGPLETMVSTMVTSGFLSKEHAQMVRFETELSDILDYFENFEAPTPKWVGLAGNKE